MLTSNSSKAHKSKHVHYTAHKWIACAFVAFVMDKMMGRMISLRSCFFRTLFIHIRFNIQHRSSSHLIVLHFLSPLGSTYYFTILKRKKLFTTYWYKFSTTELFNSSPSTVKLNAYPIHVNLDASTVIIACMYQTNQQTNKHIHVYQ